jgi:hypothetical protein
MVNWNRDIFKPMEPTDKSEQKPILLPVDESSIFRHNIACAAAIIAEKRGIELKHGGVNENMDKIIHDVMNYYDYTLWYLENYHLAKILKVTERPHSSVWKPS